MANMSELDLMLSIIDEEEQKEGRQAAPEKRELSAVHQGDTDSSDDEDNKYFEEKKYNQFGAAIKRKLKEDDYLEKTKFDYERPKTGFDDLRTTFVEPLFFTRVMNPVVSSDMIKTLSNGRKAINLSKLRSHTMHGNLKEDWITGGVIINKSPPKMSAKAKEYIIWTFSDLKGDILTASLFLFGRSYTELWKTPVGTVFGILNPKVMDSHSKSKDEATLSVFNPDQVMIWGRSPELGKCKGRKKDGQECTAIVNKYSCEFCVHHVRSEYRKFSGRSELQSSSCGTLPSLRNKVLGKNEVFYGGKSFLATSLTKSVSKKSAKEIKHLTALGADVKSPPKKIAKVETPFAPRTAELLKKLSEPPTSAPKETSKKFSTLVPKLSDPSLDVMSKTPTLTNPSLPKSKSALQSKFNSLLHLTGQTVKKKTVQSLRQELNTKTQIEAKNDETINKPKNSQGQSRDQTQTPPKTPNTYKLILKEDNMSPKPSNSVVEQPDTQTKSPIASQLLLQSLSNRSIGSSIKNTQRMSQAKRQALEFVKKNGLLNKDNSPQEKKLEKIVKAVKRNRCDLSDDEENTEKPVFSERFLKLLNEPIGSQYLLDYLEMEKMSEYFNKLESREKLEEKMLSTYKVECKAVKCLTCKYLWFKASEECKKEGHPLKVIDTVKRFFKCGKCTNRTVSLHIIPLVNCSNCGESKWLRAPMMREKLCLPGHKLSLRGGEQKHFNSQVENANLDLLVPDEGTSTNTSSCT